MLPSDRHQYFSLRWNNYQNNMTSVFHQLLESQSFVDVTLACENNFLKAHKVVLSACSTFFQKLLLDNPCDHATIIMPSDICFADLQFIIKFVYRGEIDVSEPELQSLLRTAEHLQIKGLCDINEKIETYSEPLFKRKNKNQTTKCHQQKLDNTENIELNSNESFNSATEQTNEDLSKQKNNVQLQQPLILQQQQQQSTQSDKENKEKMTSLGMGMGMNGSLMGVSMQFLDFAPEPPAPSATPVTENVELSTNSTHDQEIRRKFETLRSLDPSDNLEVDRISQQHSIQQLSQSSSPHSEHSERKIPLQSDTIIIKTQSDIDNHQNEHQKALEHQQQMQEHQQQQESLQQQQQQQQHQDQGNQSSRSSTMDVDQLDIKQEPLHGMIITPEIVTMITPSHMEMYQSDTSEDSKMLSSNEIKVEYTELTSPNDPRNVMGPKTWTPEDMTSALDALRTKNMSLTKASVTYGIPSTTLWQRAHRLGIDTPKKETPIKSWNEDSLNHALEALRTGQISANKASKAYGIPSSTLYKIARREGIRLAAPFNAAPTTWTPEDLERALEAIRTGQASVQKASVEFGIPTGTLYGRCKREGIELSRSNPTPWSEDAMTEALEAVRVGQMSINQAAIHFNLPYSSLYGRFKRGKYENSGEGHMIDTSPENTQQFSPLMVAHQQSHQSPQQAQNTIVHIQHHPQLQQQTATNSQEMYLIQPKIERS